MFDYSSQRRRVAFLFAFCLSGTISGFSLDTVSATAPAAHSSQCQTKLHVAPSYTPNSLEIRTSSLSQQQLRNDYLSRFWKKTKKRVTNLFPKTKKKQKEDDYERRKRQWTNQYTNVNSLRKLFGENRNTLWGDLDATTSRRLYKTLLPRALLEMHKLGIRPDDLAPLAYKARLAAKLYARERSQVPVRVCAVAYDGYRQWRRYGKFQSFGMTYPQVWDKYESMIMDELGQNGDLADEDVTAKICLMILERSCKTNERIDKLLLRPGSRGEQANTERELDLTTAIDQLERDVRELLKPLPNNEKESRASRIQTPRLLVRAKKPLEFVDTTKDEDDSVFPVPWNDRERKHVSRPKEWEDSKHKQL